MNAETLSTSDLNHLRVSLHEAALMNASLINAYHSQLCDNTLTADEKKHKRNEIKRLHRKLKRYNTLWIKVRDMHLDRRRRRRAV